MSDVKVTALEDMLECPIEDFFSIEKLTAPEIDLSVNSANSARLIIYFFIFGYTNKCGKLIVKKSFIETPLSQLFSKISKENYPFSGYHNSTLAKEPIKKYLIKMGLLPA